MGRNAGICINLGIFERIANGHTLFNSQVNIDRDGSVLGVHRMIQPTFAERYVWAQRSGHSPKNWRLSLGHNLGGLACWEHTMNGARQALINQNQHIHSGGWPALSTMAGFESVADAQSEGLMKAHALTAQVFVITAANYVVETCLEWMKVNLEEQDLVKAGGGWSSVLHPFCAYLAGPHTGAEEKLVQAGIDMAELAQVKVWIDAVGHHSRTDILHFKFDLRAI